MGIYVLDIYMFPWPVEMTLPFAHPKWKGQPCSNIDTIDMFAEKRQRDG